VSDEADCAAFRDAFCKALDTLPRREWASGDIEPDLDRMTAPQLRQLVKEWIAIWTVLYATRRDSEAGLKLQARIVSLENELNLRSPLNDA